jgi:hypothetical protein
VPLGRATYGMLTGEAPFTGPTAQAIVPADRFESAAVGVAIDGAWDPHETGASHGTFSSSPNRRSR